MRDDIKAELKSMAVSFGIFLVLVGFITGAIWYENHTTKENRMECYERSDEPIFDNDRCVDAAEHKNITLRLIENNEPVTRESVMSVTGLDAYEAGILLEYLANEGLIYEYDRGWSDPGWAMVN